MTARYAIYFTPPADHPLTRKGAAWLGRDAFTGATVPQPELESLRDLDLATLTDDPRHYGFHATLKAPFTLAAGTSEAALVDFLGAFASDQEPFDLFLTPATLGPFLALRPVSPSPAMDALHGACVRAFEPFRAPLSEADLARRRRSPLTAEQEIRLVTYGYPYIFEDFRFHMTLTRRLPDEALRAKVLAAAKSFFGDPVVKVSGLALFRQQHRDDAFTVAAFAPFTERAVG